MKRERDSQRKKLYTAERETFTYHAQSIGLDECATLVSKIQNSDYITRKYMPRWPGRIAVTDGRGSRRALSHGGKISLPVWARMKWMVIHEMAHELHRYQRAGRNGAAGHGWQYAEIYLDLVGHFMGHADRDRLKESFRKHRVKYCAPRKGRILSEAEKQALRDRLAAARAAKAVAKIDAEVFRVAA